MSGAFDYSRMQATAQRLIKRFGKTSICTLNEPGAKTGPSFNPTMGSPTTHPVSAVQLSYSKMDVDGTRILSTDKKFYIAYVDMDNQPSTDWTLSVKSKGDAAPVVYKIINIMPLEPGDLVLLWEAQCRAS